MAAGRWLRSSTSASKVRLAAHRHAALCWAGTDFIRLLIRLQTFPSRPATRPGLHAEAGHPWDGDQSQDGAILLELRRVPHLRIGTEWQMDGPTQANLPGVTSRRG
jgi:hypothetical protein